MSEPKRCAYKGCQLPAEDSSGLCILHQPSPKDVERFKEVLYAQLDERGPEDKRNRRFWFAGYVFPMRVFVRETRDEASDKVLVLPARMAKVSFYGATFEEDASFKSAMFEEDASFKNATFKERVSFSEARFARSVEFTSVTVEGHFSARRAGFQTDAYFSNTEFAGGVDFSSAIFSGEAYFWEALFVGDAHFSVVCFWGDAYFGDAAFGRNTNFSEARFTASAIFSRTRFGGTVVFRGTTFKKDVSFTGAEAATMDLGVGKPCIRGWGHDRCGVRLDDYITAPSFWRFAQRTFSALGEREKADAAFYLARIAKWKAFRAVDWPSHEGGKRWSWIPWLLRCLPPMITKAWTTPVWAVDCVFIRWTTSYGASPCRVAATWFLVITAFGAVYSLVPSLIGNGSHVWSLKNWVVGLHFSVTTFTTLGLGDLRPERLVARVLTSAEAILGAVLVALAILLVGRRFTR